MAHEGHVRMCRHKTVTWATVLASLPGGRINNNFKDVLDSNWHKQTSSGEGLESFSNHADLRIVCDHPSHHPSHHQSSYSSSSSSSSSSSPKVLLMAPRSHLPPPPPYERFMADDHAESPSFIVHDMMASGVKHKVITWSYTAHVDLTGLGDPDNNGAITAQAFRDRIVALRQGHGPARYIAPKDYPGILQELRCVDPDRCGCLLYPGFQRKERQTTCQDRHEVVRRLVSRVTDIDCIRVRLASCDVGDCGNLSKGHARCVQVVYTRTIRLQGFYFNPAPNWPPAMMRGTRANRYVILLRFRDAFRANAVPYGWYQALDARFFDLNDDAGRQRPIWCRGKQCQLNPSYLRQNYVLEEETNADCKFGCEDTQAIGAFQDGKERRNRLFMEIPAKVQWGRWQANKYRHLDPVSLAERLSPYFDRCKSSAVDQDIRCKHNGK